MKTAEIARNSGHDDWRGPEASGRGQVKAAGDSPL